MQKLAKNIFYMALEKPETNTFVSYLVCSKIYNKKICKF